MAPLTPLRLVDHHAHSVVADVPDRAGFERVGFGLEQITPESLTHDIRLLQAN